MEKMGGGVRAVLGASDHVYVREGFQLLAANMYM